jgi:hypothetical protein
MKYIVKIVLLICFSVISGCLPEATKSSSDPDIIPIEPQNISLNWSPNFVLEDGSSFQPVEIESYTLFWGREQGSLLEQIEIPSADIETYIFTVTESGDYYFAVALNTIYGTKSGPSNVVHKKVN